MHYKIMEFQKMNSKIDKLRKLVYEELSPAKKAITEMQKLVIELYKELGHSEYSAWFSTYYET